MALLGPCFSKEADPINQHIAKKRSLFTDFAIFEKLLQKPPNRPF